MRILLIFGATTFVANTVLYFSLRAILKFHGAVQVGLAMLGAICVCAWAALPGKENK